jgi:hypothetical protein
MSVLIPSLYPLLISWVVSFERIVSPIMNGRGCAAPLRVLRLIVGREAAMAWEIVDGTAT